MPATCPECGARLADGGSCIDLFHAMLLLEYEVAADPLAVAGGRGAVAHYHAVSAYILQHPEGMSHRAEALDGVRRNLADQLAGRATLPEVRRRVRLAADGPTRVTRRPGDEVPSRPVESWPMSVAEVLDGGAEGYCDRVAAWAESVIRTLRAAGA